MLGETVVSVAPASSLSEEVVLLASESSGADSNLDVVDLASDQFEADMEEAVFRSLEDRSRETNRDLLSQPGCSHWPASLPPQYSQGGPPPPSGPPQTGQSGAPLPGSNSSTPPDQELTPPSSTPISGSPTVPAYSNAPVPAARQRGRPRKNPLNPLADVFAKKR